MTFRTTNGNLMSSLLLIVISSERHVEIFLTSWHQCAVFAMKLTTLRVWEEQNLIQLHADEIYHYQQFMWWNVTIFGNGHIVFVIKMFLFNTCLWHSWLITCFVGCSLGSIFQKQGSVGNDICAFLWKLGALYMLVLASNIL